jgi:hypothetical protein
VCVDIEMKSGSPVVRAESVHRDRVEARLFCCKTRECVQR